jgi:hypothetical protein
LKLTPNSFIKVNPDKVNSESGYTLASITLNTNFLIKYLKEQNIILLDKDIEVIEVLLDNQKVRDFLFNWNKEKDLDKSYQDFVIYTFKKPLLEAIITFLRVIYHYDTQMIVDHVLDRNTAKEYQKISKIIHYLKYDSETRRPFRDMLMKIDDLYDIMPVALRKISNDLYK